jgi:hypothetical protein
VVQANIAHPEFLGSYSIKNVLTPLVPDLGYEGLQIAGGLTASIELARLMQHGHEMEADERKRKRAALLEYCRFDTWAMVRLLERLGELAGSR